MWGIFLIAAIKNWYIDSGGTFSDKLGFCALIMYLCYDIRFLSAGNGIGVMHMILCQKLFSCHTRRVMSTWINEKLFPYCRFQVHRCRDLMHHNQFSTSSGLMTAMEIQTHPSRRGSPHWSHGIMEEMKFLLKDHGIIGSQGILATVERIFHYDLFSFRMAGLKYLCNYRRALHRSGKDHSILLVLPSGIYHYKFIVDGELRHIPDLPYIAYENDQIFNVLDVNVSIYIYLWAFYKS